MNRDYEQSTGNIYGCLFTAYNKDQFDDSVKLFFERHRRWGIDLNWWRGKICLDAGCGGGRYLAALAQLGAKEVKGVDISAQAVQAANARLAERGLSQARAVTASVLALPFPDNYFDYVVSSGVIHHTPAPFRAWQELVRVLKPGGKMFLSVYGRGGLKWLLNDIFRYSLCRVLPFRALESFFRIIGVPANKRYSFMDNLYVPYCHRFKESQIRSWFVKAGFKNIRRLKFERYDYETLRSRIIHGQGWIQIYADKT